MNAPHFSHRLELLNAAGGEAPNRCAVLDKLFVAEARERIERMHDALAHLPADGYAIKHEAIELAQEAQTAELFGIMHLARQLAEITNIRAKNSTPIKCVIKLAANSLRCLSWWPMLFLNWPESSLKSGVARAKSAACADISTRWT